MDCGVNLTCSHYLLILLWTWVNFVKLFSLPILSESFSGSFAIVSPVAARESNVWLVGTAATPPVEVCFFLIYFLYICSSCRIWVSPGVLRPGLSWMLSVPCKIRFFFSINICFSLSHVFFSPVLVFSRWSKKPCAGSDGRNTILWWRFQLPSLYDVRWFSKILCWSVSEIFS